MPTAQAMIRPGDRLTDGELFDVRVERIAAGGFGVIAMGPDQMRGGHWSALKSIRPDMLAYSGRVREMFIHEAITWTGLWPHPNLLRARSLSVIDEQPLLLLEYAPSGSLREMLQARGALELEQGLDWAQQIAAGMVALHTPDPDHLRDHPLVHRDLKPENILIDEQGMLKITDFALALDVAGAGRDLSDTTLMPFAADFPMPLQPTITGSHRYSVPAMPAVPTVPVAPAEPWSPQRQPGGGIADLVPAQFVELAPSPWQAQNPQTVISAIVSRVQPLLQRLPSLIGMTMPPTVTATITRTDGGRAGNGVVGTPAYMAPEQWLGPGYVTPATDVYAFGLLLSELLAGRHALLDMGAYYSLEDWLRAHRESTPRSLREVAPALPQEVEDLYLRCLAKDPEDRPTAGEALAVVRHAVEGLGRSAYSPHMPEAGTPHDEAAVWHSWSVVYETFEQHAEALVRNDRALTLDPENIGVYVTRGNIMFGLNRLDEALAAYDRALALGSRDSRVQITRGNILLGRDRLDDALAAYDAAVLLGTRDVKSLVKRASILQELGRLADALAAFRAILDDVPETDSAERAAVLLSCGTVLTGLRQFDEAVTSFVLADALMPDAGDILFAWAECEWEWGQREALAGHHAEAHLHLQEGTRYAAQAARQGLNTPQVKPIRAAELHAVSVRNKKVGRPPFSDAHIRTQKELLWLMDARQWSGDAQASDRGRANFAGASFEGAKLVGAMLCGANLNGARLAGANLIGANLSGASLIGADLSGASLIGVNFSDATLTRATLQGALLTGSDLRRADLTDADLSGADLSQVRLDGDSTLTRVLMDTKVRLVGVQWNDARIDTIDWSRAPRLGDELAIGAATADSLATACRDAERAYRGLVIALRAQGLTNVASEYRMRQQQLARRALRQEGKIGSWIFSCLLEAVSGYGERPGRTVATYLLVLCTFALIFLSIAHLAGATLAAEPWYAWPALSLTAFHGRGFFPGMVPPNGWVVFFAGLEAVIGLFVELIFIATFSRRFLSD